MRTPAQCADYMAEPVHRCERGVQHHPAHRVIHHVESRAARMRRDIALDGRISVDRRGPERCQEGEIPAGRGGEHPGAAGAGDLHGDMAHAAGTPQDQQVLPRLHAGTIDQPFPGRDEAKGQGSCLPHRQDGRLWRQQRRVDRRELGQRALHAADPRRSLP